MADRPVILVAEDSENDVVILRKALSQAFIDHHLFVVTDGDQCIDYLSGSSRFCDRAQYPFPHLLLLDLHMPRKDGFQVLEWIRRQPGSKQLPVVVLTSSQNLHDMKTAYQLGAASFLLKPPSFKDLSELSRFLPVSFLLPLTSPVKTTEIPPAANTPSAGIPVPPPGNQQLRCN